MTGHAMPRCPRCGEDLVLEMDPGALPEAQARVLLADPPFRFVCTSSGCFPRPRRRPDQDAPDRPDGP